MPPPSGPQPPTHPRGELNHSWKVHLRGGGADFCLGGVVVGGSREPTPSRPVGGRMAGTKGEQPRRRLRGGGDGRKQAGGTGQRGCSRALVAPTTVHTPPARPVPYPSNEQLSLVWPRTPGPAESEATKARPALSRDPGPAPRLCGAGARVSATGPPPLPTHCSPHPPGRRGPADAPPDFGAQQAGGETGECAAGRGRRAPRGRAEERGRRAHLAH